ncbi:30S ribosomal protein S1 [Ferroacidibacillus organovorans]|uniref:S1 motif domain-containing protein n=1 Tax=Ferroacidibacillus organovorans TaxID=1765683 RepID=A0A853KD20_9BACL|nr:30S ribosomal protein S1 [Ferroacidibacillus organovorans]KYP80484.1 hypothetical protein AYJ22_02220 [Ferroacidibacillus organovorans]OAG94713.1 hypothetical protein AYW79_03990 [Ferroacidibacillus organovorans]
MSELVNEEQSKEVASEAKPLDAVVTRVESDAVFVQFDGTREGVISRAQFSQATGGDLTVMARVGQTIRAVILREEEDGTVRLSRKNAVDASTWETLRALAESQEVIEVTIATAVKGGLVADLMGARAFMPASQSDLRFAADLTPLVGSDVYVIVTEVDEENKRLIISRKRVLEMEEQSARAERIHDFHPGDLVHGRVARMTQFGAFIDLGGIDGLLHVSEMSWSRVARPEEVISIGDEIEVRVLRVEPENGKVSLSMKHTQESPWQKASKAFQIGDIVEGEVRRLSSFGAFVEVAPGVEGLVHVSQISRQRVDQPSDVLEPGQRVMVKVLDIRPEEERMSLSIKEAQMREEKRRAPEWTEKSNSESQQTTLGDLFGDLLRDRFKS